MSTGSCTARWQPVSGSTSCSLPPCGYSGRYLTLPSGTHARHLAASFARGSGPAAQLALEEPAAFRLACIERCYGLSCSRTTVWPLSRTGRCASRVSSSHSLSLSFCVDRRAAVGVIRMSLTI
jgi:hypothetical protein